MNVSIAAGPGASSRISTPRPAFLTHPDKFNSRASRYTNGRKPTPWTTPKTVSATARPVPARGSFPGFLAFTL